MAWLENDKFIVLKLSWKIKDYSNSTDSQQRGVNLMPSGFSPAYFSAPDSLNITDSRS